MKLVIDASVILKWYLGDRADETFQIEAQTLLRAILDERVTMFAPPHWLAEVLAVLAREQPATVPQAFRSLGNLNAELEADEDCYLVASELSHRLKQHLFDTLYHAVALKHGAQLVTADTRYASAARGEGSIVLIQDLRLDQHDGNSP